MSLNTSHRPNFTTYNLVNCIQLLCSRSVENGRTTAQLVAELVRDTHIYMLGQELLQERQHFMNLILYIMLSCVCVFSDPSAVTGLRADNELSTHSLLVSWTAAVGISDGYSLQLLDDNDTVIANASVPANNNSYLFKNLTPGRWYKAHVQTVSGTAKSKDVTTKGQTRKTLFVCLK